MRLQRMSFIERRETDQGAPVPVFPAVFPAKDDPSFRLAVCELVLVDCPEEAHLWSW